MNLTVDPGDPTPPYEQVRRQVADLVQAGRLRPGDRLPSVRQLAGDLGLAAGTIARAYRELETEGLLVSRRGAGTRVSAEARSMPKSARTAQLRLLADAYVEKAQTLGCSEQEIRDALRFASSRTQDVPGR
jgi:GntR family transcriptional regulator